MKDLSKAVELECVKWGCDNAKLVYMRKGQSRQCNKNCLIAGVNGWFCPVCAASYGDISNDIQ